MSKSLSRNSSDGQPSPNPNLYASQMKSVDEYSPSPSMKPQWASPMRRRKRCTNRRRPANTTTIDSFEVIARTARTTYPGLGCGHENCIGRPVVTPKNMGWLWSIRDSCGITINRNWVPGAVPRRVANVMKKARDGVKYPEDVLHPKWKNSVRRKSRKRHSQFRGDPNDETSLTSTNSEEEEEEDNSDGQQDDEELPILTVTKHAGEYAIQMNPIRDKDGKAPQLDPVRFRLQTKRNREYASSQSSLHIELLQPRNRAFLRT